MANQYTLSLSAQISAAGLASLQSQLDTWAKEYTLKLNAAIQQVTQATTQAATSSATGGATGGVPVPSSTDTEAVEKFNLASQGMNATSTVTNNLAQQMTKMTETQAIGIGQVETRTISLNKGMTQFNDTTRQSSVAVKSWIGDLENAIEKIMLWAVATGAIYGALKAIGDGVQYVKDLNKAMTDTQMVTGDTDSKIQQLTQDYHNMAMELGATTLEIQAANLEFLRQGKTASDAAELTKDAIMISKLAMTDASSAATDLTAIMNGFKMQASDATGVMDKLLALSNSTKTSAAISFGDLATAMQSSASVAQDSKVSFSELASYIATIGTVTQQSAETVGNSLKMMMDRMIQIKANVSEGSDSFNNVQIVLQKYKMSLLDTTGAFRPLGEVIDEVGQKWSTLDTFQQRQLGTAIAGARQINSFLALMDNYSNAMAYQTAETESAGLAQDRYAAYLNSVQAALDRSTTAWQGFWAASFNQNGIKYFYDVSAAIANFLGNMGGIVPVLTTVIALMGALIPSSIVGAWNKITSAVDTLGKSLKAAVSPEILAAQKSLAAANEEVAASELAVAEAENVVDATEGENVVATNALAAAKTRMAAAAEVQATAEEGVAAASTAASAGAASIIPVLGWIVAGIMVAVGAWNTYKDAQSKATQAEIDARTKALSDAQSKLQSLQTEQSQLSTLANTYETLAAKTNKTSQESQQFLDIQNQLHSLLPSINGSYDDMGNYALAAGTSVDTLTTAYKNLMKAEQAQIVLELQAGVPGAVTDVKKDAEDLKLATELVDEYNKTIAKPPPAGSENNPMIISVKQATEGLPTAMAKAGEATNKLNLDIAKLTEAYLAGDDAQKKIIDDQLKAAGVSQQVIDAIEKAQDVANKPVAVPIFDPSVLDEYAKELKTITSEYDDLNSALQKQKDGSLTPDDIVKLISAHSDLTKYLKIEGDNVTLDTDAIKKYEAEQLGAQIITLLVAEAKAKDAGATDDQIAAIESELKILGMLVGELDNLGNKAMTASEAASKQAALTSMVVSMLRQQKEAEKQALQDELDAYTKSIDAQKAALDAQKKAITDATDAYTKMADAEKTALKAEEDAYTKVIDAEKTKIQLMHDEQAYKDELSKKEQAVSETQMQLDALSLDNSQEAAAQRLKLQDTLTTQTADLNKTQADKQYTDQQTALDNELAAYKAEKDGEIAAIQSAEDAYKSASDARIKLIENEQSALDNNLKVYTTNIQNQEKAIDDYVSKSGIMVQDALQLIATNSATLYQDLINWNAVYGTGIENDVTKAWMDASAAAAYYQAIVSANSGLINTVKDVYAAKKASGFASGGLVVGGIEGQDSVHTKLMPGEGVLNKTAMNFLGVSGLNNLNRGLPATTSTGGNGGIQISMPISVAGNLDKAILPDLEKMISKTFEKLNSTLAQRGIRRTTNQYAN